MFILFKSVLRLNHDAVLILFQVKLYIQFNTEQYTIADFVCSILPIVPPNMGCGNGTFFHTLIP